MRLFLHQAKVDTSDELSECGPDITHDQLELPIKCIGQQIRLLLWHRWRSDALSIGLWRTPVPGHQNDMKPTWQRSDSYGRGIWVAALHEKNDDIEYMIMNSKIQYDMLETKFQLQAGAHPMASARLPWSSSSCISAAAA